MDEYWKDEYEIKIKRAADAIKAACKVRGIHCAPYGYRRVLQHVFRELEVQDILWVSYSQQESDK
jgi:hypothetical protein